MLKSVVNIKCNVIPNCAIKQFNISIDTLTLLAQICLHIMSFPHTSSTHIHDSYATFKCKVSAKETTLQTESYSKQKPD